MHRIFARRKNLWLTIDGLHLVYLINQKQLIGSLTNQKLGCQSWGGGGALDIYHTFDQKKIENVSFERQTKVVINNQNPSINKH